MTNPRIRAFFDEPTNTVSYLVWDPDTAHGAVIDPVLDFDLASGEADVRSAEAILAAAEEEGVTIERVLETHAHADHLSAAPFIKAKTGARIGIGAHIRDVQKIFRPVFGMDDLKADGSDFDDLFADGETFAIGSLTVEVLHVPGHTPANIAYKIGDAVFVGDTNSANPLFRALYDFYSFNIMPLLGQLIAGSAESYACLPETIRMFPLPAELATIIADCGFRNVTYCRMTNSMVVAHLATKG